MTSVTLGAAPNAGKRPKATLCPENRVQYNLHGLANADRAHHVFRMNDERQKEARAATAPETAAGVNQTDDQGNKRVFAEFRKAERVAASEAAEAAETAGGEIGVIKDRLFEEEFTVHKSLRYHAKRRSFFDALHRTAQAVTAISASAAFADIISTSPGWIATVGAFVLAVSSAADLVVGFSSRARQHDGLYQQFSDLAEEISMLDQVTSEAAREFKAKRLRIEKDETSSIDAINVLCHNEECEARGLEGKARVGFFKRVFANFFTFPPNQFPPLNT